VFLQGGPGHEAPLRLARAAGPAWLDQALEHYRVVLIDQRGTGRSTPVSDGILDRGAEAVAEHLTHLRADAIVRDCEALRAHLGADRWNVLGQSFGGFTTLAYLSAAASSIDAAYLTGGLSTVTRTPDEVYALCYDKMRDASERYYRRFPEHRDRMRRLVDLAAAGGIVLPDGEVVSPSRACARWARRWAPTTAGRRSGSCSSSPPTPTRSGTTSPPPCRSTGATRSTSSSTSPATRTAT
jgi:proline iminopeptidase